MLAGADGEDGFPIVAWLVPLNGPGACQTLKLDARGTRIGTAPVADVVIDDAFMSGTHCEIKYVRSAFRLIDADSRNGCYLNDRRVRDEELIDNDVVTLGKTAFKFKTIA